MECCVRNETILKITEHMRLGRDRLYIEIRKSAQDSDFESLQG